MLFMWWYRQLSLKLLFRGILRTICHIDLKCGSRGSEQQNISTWVPCSTLFFNFAEELFLKIQNEIGDKVTDMKLCFIVNPVNMIIMT